jgi:hypothetical protein
MANVLTGKNIGVLRADDDQSHDFLARKLLRLCDFYYNAPLPQPNSGTETDLGPGQEKLVNDNTHLIKRGVLDLRLVREVRGYG